MVRSFRALTVNSTIEREVTRDPLEGADKVIWPPGFTHLPISANASHFVCSSGVGGDVSRKNIRWER